MGKVFNFFVKTCIILFIGNIVSAPLWAQGRVLRVMTFNIRQRTPKDKDHIWENRKDIVIDLIKTYSPDIIGMQEVKKVQFDNLREGLEGYSSFGEGRQAGHNDEHMAVFYKSKVLRLREAHNFWLSETPDVPASKSWNSRCHRMVTWGRFAFIGSEHEFYFFNTHFDHKSEEARQKSAYLVLERTSKLGDKLPVILVGDFNSALRTSFVWNVLTGKEKVEGTIPFFDCWHTAELKRDLPEVFQRPDWGPRPRWTGKEERHIDWILYRGKVRANLIEVITFNHNGRFPSDHFPYYAELIINPVSSGE